MKTVLKYLGYLIAVLLMAVGLVAIVLYIMGFGSLDLNIITTMPPTETSTPAPDGSTTLEDVQQNGTSSVTVGTPTPFIPTPSPTPSPTPEPTPEPTPSPMLAGTPLGSGTISSDTGRWIDLDAEWAAEVIDQETAKITVTIKLRSFGLQTPEKKNGLEIVVNNQMTAMDVEAIWIESSTEVITELGSYSFEVAAPAGRITLIPMEAVWHYGGYYGSTLLESITATGDIIIER